MRKSIIWALAAAAAILPAAASAEGFGGWQDQHEHGGGDHGNGGQHNGGGQHGGGQHNGGGNGGARPQGQPAQQQIRPQGQPGGQFQGHPQVQGGPQHMQPQNGMQVQGRPQFHSQGGQNWQGNRAQGQQGQDFRGQHGQGFQGQRPGFQGGPDRNVAGRQDQFRGDQHAQGNWNHGNDGYRGNNGNRGNNGYRGGRGGAQWNRGWRSDGRYNYNGYRNQNRNAFHLPRYYAPHGWGYGYRRFGVGSVLSQLLFAQDYWIDDPYDYRLPPAYGPYRWVRYYNDALLVNIYTGQVVDEAPGIFW